MQRVAIAGDSPAALSTAERLIAAGLCVDLFCERPAPFGLLRRFAGLSGAESAPAPCPKGTTPRLRLIGNVRVGTGPDADISHTDLNQLSASGDRHLVLLELMARGVAITTWEGLCRPTADIEDWATVAARAQRAPVCF
ncbi:methylenetetrahydrofolate--tRNA-(uracil-5-)-methyltransferase [Corynebacterium minutissimum]|uniref:Methylenetetrahydrofolate--tRNA-(Uracil-5-)-methyltransferase n=1 Tax=Corynebacterium minutissimum TaxID=38301 RepID=A0A376D470_9CORY|nr:methylenetetrahydrofolate--tRNA-(uracil-5-)-methyltransferase [Corynebacterium minutissimum]QRP61859.1 methylenetetrahydrofolate--tRNA-(uracil-5-)-methyltransferase [Corynebacterium minutissimum]STC81404.1 methylenetetrahydrofolate--tRNA-(uracil-5-)-methyltransferase [Corynebacterium minutissimum]